MDARRWILFFAILTVSACTVWLIMWRTSAPGLKVQEQENKLDLVVEERKRLRDETRLIREKRRLAEVTQQKQVPAMAPEPAATRNCVIASTWSTSQVNPIPLGTAMCLVRSQESPNFWVVFNAEPKEIVGTASFNEMVANNQGDLVEVSRCITSQSQDQCLGYLKTKLGIPLVVFNNTSGIQINM